MSTELRPILPGAMLGILGGGQLGRMFGHAARTLGYRVMVLDPDPESPAGKLADVHIAAAYDDASALRRLGTQCAAVTTEFENVPAASLLTLARHCRVAPGAAAVDITQDRDREKSWLREQGFATAEFRLITDAADLAQALAATGSPALLKVARFGYDGKGQTRVDTEEDARAAFLASGGQRCVLEALVKLDCELSVVLARSADGRCALFPVAENQHMHGVLDLSIVPARVPEALARQASDTARTLADRLGYVGVMAVEFFVSNGRLLVNELAPRPHNSGHFTLDACTTDQFEQQVRALCGLPLGDPRLLSPAVMLNILGDRWQGDGPHWAALFEQSNVKLHLYGKALPRAGRKMGHCTVLAADPDAALRTAKAVRDAL